ncbi:hypothetical protein Poly30_30720 [Planctomycetes bacterium Poly30]|uniref:Lipid/polyisoprenoid-binding YceI-like domain-containing protein n=1 Tax=Saltatorellus ferox TaxID=2528018 RepID=A0A518ETY1_9BACT|nr:hypothetical protein Poly30_30720 [Planctomycetes bacterium Poly30]
MYVLLPMVVSLAGALAAPELAPQPRQLTLPEATETADTPVVLTLPLRVPKSQLFQLLQTELRERKLLKDFQVVTSKFSGGRVLLDQLDVRPCPRPGTVRLEAHARLRFERKQLGVLWRGLKSHKKWFQKGDKDAAKVRLTCTAELGGPNDGALVASLTDIRVKVESRLHPARGLSARFRLDPREFEWAPEGGLFDFVKLSSLRIAAVERDALRLEVGVARQPR